MKKSISKLAVLVSVIFILTACSSGSGGGSSGQFDLYDPPFNPSEILDDGGYMKDIKALDYVELFDYNNFYIPNDIYDISEDTINAEINNLLYHFPDRSEIYDRPIEDGDLVNIDYVGSIDGEEFAGGNSMGMGSEVQAGTDQFIDDFLWQIIGRMPGETFDVNVSFPDPYPNNPDLAGQPALFVTTINYIVEETPVTELTDEFIAENLTESFGWETVDDVRQYIIDGLRNPAIDDYLWEFLTVGTVVKSVPAELMNYQQRKLVEHAHGEAERSGQDINEFISQNTGFTNLEEYLESSMEGLESEARFLLIVQAIAEDMGMVINESDVSAYFEEFSGSPDYSQYEDFYGIGYLKQMIMIENVMDYIVDNAVYG